MNADVAAGNLIGPFTASQIVVTILAVPQRNVISSTGKPSDRSAIDERKQHSFNCRPWFISRVFFTSFQSAGHPRLPPPHLEIHWPKPPIPQILPQNEPNS